MIHYLALYHWSKFQKNPTVFGGVMAKKPTRSSLKSNFLLLRKHLKIDNLATTNATPMKLTTIIYRHETFYLAKNCGVTHGAWKTSEREPENQFFGLISWNFRTVSKTIIYVMRYIALHYCSIFQKNLTAFRGVMARKPPRSSLQW